MLHDRIDCVAEHQDVVRLREVTVVVDPLVLDWLPPDERVCHARPRARSTAITPASRLATAFGDGQAVPRRARRGLERFTETTITTLAALDEQLAQVRLRGYATCRGEYESSAWGVSAPVVDRSGRLVAVLSIWVPAHA
jgi:DNA-binding IclR family transcriptional regulator